MECSTFRNQVIYVHLKDKAPEWLTTYHPMGFVPALERDGEVLYESMVCAQFVDDAFPQAKLTPSDPLAKARQMMLICDFDKVC